MRRANFKLVVIKIQAETQAFPTKGLRYLPARLSPWPPFLLRGKQPDPLPWPLMSNVLPDDLRVLEFPDSDNFHVNPAPPGSMSPALLSWLKVWWPGHCRALRDIRQSREPCGKIALQGYYRRVAIRKFRGSDSGVAERLQIRLQPVNLWPGFWQGSSYSRGSQSQTHNKGPSTSPNCATPRSRPSQNMPFKQAARRQRKPCSLYRRRTK